ncbi:hypothetical protein ACC691_39080, partial [Rhizobium johnstonii]|uniref:hypothetical protein n=1 Tax=Rhizobium johnstonii TaxID=3019933 RepID=UPI003F985241
GLVDATTDEVTINGRLLPSEAPDVPADGADPHSMSSWSFAGGVSDPFSVISRPRTSIRRSTAFLVYVSSPVPISAVAASTRATSSASIGS